MRYYELSESIVGQTSDILTRRSSSQDAYMEFHEKTEEILQRLVSQYQSKQYPKAPWPVVPARALAAVWKTSAKAGFVRNERALDKIAELFFNNVANLVVNNEIGEHGTQSKEEALAEYIEDGSLDIEELTEFVDWAIETESGGWRISDYGIDRLVVLACLLLDCENSDEKLQVCDAILNVTHPRSDLASWFVEGGSATMDGLFHD